MIGPERTGGYRSFPMRASGWAMAVALAAMASGAAAATQVVPTVISGSAAWSKKLPHTIVLNAVVQFNDGCWSKPRFVPPLTHAGTPQGDTAPVEIQATHATQKMCTMIVRKVHVPTRSWRIYPNPKLTSVKFVGSTTPVTAVIVKR